MGGAASIAVVITCSPGRVGVETISLWEFFEPGKGNWATDVGRRGGCSNCL